MLNPRSPIVNQMIGGYQQGYPPNYSVGYNGYNGQGYTGYYGNNIGYNYYNPIFQQNLIKQQQEEAERRHREEVEFNKKLSRIAHTHDGSGISEEDLDRIYDPKSTFTPEQLAEEYEFNKVAYSIQNANIQTGGDPTLLARADNIAKYHDKFIKKDCGLLEFFDQAGSLLVDGMLREEKHRNRDLSGTYDSDSYKKLLGRSAPYAGKFSNNIDDNVVTLPAHLKQRLDASYEERRSQFIASIMNQKGV